MGGGFYSSLESIQNLLSTQMSTHLWILGPLPISELLCKMKHTFLFRPIRRTAWNTKTWVIFQSSRVRVGWVNNTQAHKICQKQKHTGLIFDMPRGVWVGFFYYYFCFSVAHIVWRKEQEGLALRAAPSLPHCEPREKISFTLPPL